MRKRLIGVALPFLLTACGSSPKNTMVAFCNDLSAGKGVEAFGAFGNKAQLLEELAELDQDPQSRQMLDAVFGGAKCAVTAAEGEVVTVQMDTVNGRAVMANVMADAMGLAFMSAFGGAGGESMMQEALTAKLLEGFADEKAPRLKSTLKVNMERVEGRWVPRAIDHEPFLSALVGGLDQLGQ